MAAIPVENICWNSEDIHSGAVGALGPVIQGQTMHSLAYWWGLEAHALQDKATRDQVQVRPTFKSALDQAKCYLVPTLSTLEMMYALQVYNMSCDASARKNLVKAFPDDRYEYLLLSLDAEKQFLVPSDSENDPGLCTAIAHPAHPFPVVTATGNPLLILYGSSFSTEFRLLEKIPLRMKELILSLFHLWKVPSPQPPVNPILAWITGVREAQGSSFGSSRYFTPLRCDTSSYHIALSRPKIEAWRTEGPGRRYQAANRRFSVG